MSEQLRAPLHPESKAELHHSKEHRERLDHLEATGKAQERSLRASTEQLRHSVEQHALSGTEIAPFTTEQRQDNPSTTTVTRELTAMTYRRALTRLQKRESITDRTLSKFVHNGFVFASSEALGKTLARPSGFIGGGFVALIGSIVFLSFARHYGFRYNFLFFVAFFMSGLLLGLALEVVVRLIQRRRA